MLRPKKPRRPSGGWDPVPTTILIGGLTVLDSSRRWNDGGDVGGSEVAGYDSFLTALSELKLGKFDEEFLESAARANHRPRELS